MAGIQDFTEWHDDFLGTVAALPTSASAGTPWLIADTSAAGSPTYTTGTSTAKLKFSDTSEVQNLCLHFGDSLDFDIDDIINIQMRVKMGQAAVNAATSLAFGLASARNDAINSLTASAVFRVIGSASTTALVIKTKTATEDNDNIATGKSLVNAYQKFVIDFSGGKSDVKFYVNGDRVAASTKFDMSGYALGLQPFVQLQKTAATAEDEVIVDYVRVVARRS